MTQDIERLIEWYRGGAKGVGPMGAYVETADALRELLRLRAAQPNSGERE